MTTKTPRIGALFTYDGRGFRVTNYLKPTENPSRTQQRVGPDRVAVEFCSADEAVYVSGAGASGCIVRIDSTTFRGLVAWPEQQLRDAERSAALFIGQKVW